MAYFCQTFVFLAKQQRDNKTNYYMRAGKFFSGLAQNVWNGQLLGQSKSITKVTQLKEIQTMLSMETWNTMKKMLFTIQINQTMTTRLRIKFCDGTKSIKEKNCAGFSFNEGTWGCIILKLAGSETEWLNYGGAQLKWPQTLCAAHKQPRFTMPTFQR